LHDAYQASPIDNLTFDKKRAAAFGRRALDERPVISFPLPDP
jgi:hypothetical protein